MYSNPKSYLNGHEGSDGLDGHEGLKGSDGLEGLGSSSSPSPFNTPFNDFH